MNLKLSGVIRLSDKDNCLVLSSAVLKGDVVVDHTFDHSREITVRDNIGLGHKMASCDINVGEKILKYGAPIGSAIKKIASGEHIHTHNMKSDYLPTFTLNNEERSDEF